MSMPDVDRTIEDEGGKPKEPPHKLDFQVDIQDAGPCKKHLVIEIPQEEIRRQFQDSVKDLSREAQVPGFRPGRAPKDLVQRRFRKELSGQVKSSLLMACMERLDEDYKLNPISAPELDLEAIELPETGPFKFELDVEVHPEISLPEYKGMTLKRPVKTIGEKDIDAQTLLFLERYARMVPKSEGGAEQGDYVTADLTFHKDGVTINEAREIQFRLQPELRFQDGHVPDLAKTLVGVKPGENRQAEAKIGTSSPDAALRGKTIDVTFAVKDLKQLILPEVNEPFLAEIGFEDEEDLREALHGVLERRVEFLQRQALRRQIVDDLIAKTPFDLPAELVKKQERSTLRRQVAEMRESGMSDSEIRAREAEIRANAHERTLKSLKEFFLLAKIAEAEEIEVAPDDLELEIEALAARSDESPRRVRSRIEKEGLAEGLAQQILERKTIDRILQNVTVEDVAMDDEKVVETLDQTASGAEATDEDAEADAEGESA